MSAVMKEQPVTRLGDRGDVFRILQMSLEFWPQTGYGIPADENSIINMIIRCMDEELLTVLEVEGAVVGFLAGLKAPCIANESVMMGSEIAYWVEPEHRSEGNGVLLLSSAEHYAKKAGVDVWGMMSLDNVNPEKVDKLYRSMGYAPAENSYYKRLT